MKVRAQETAMFAGNMIETGTGSCRLAPTLATRNGGGNPARAPNGGRR
jgi:hypothetical protein